MNEVERAKGEKAATNIMKTLALIGLVALLALVAWLIVGVARVIPNAGNGLMGAVVSLTSRVTGSPEETVAFDLANRTFASGDTVTIGWKYEGDPENEQKLYAFRYACVDSVTLEIKAGNGWTTLPCSTAYETRETSLTIVPVSKMNRYIDVEFAIAADGTELSDTALITIENTSVADSRSAMMPNGTSTDTNGPPSEGSTAQTPAPVVVAPVVKPVTKPVTTGGAPVGSSQTYTRPVAPVTSGPADLAVDIQATGVLTKVKGIDTFFELSPIPTDRNGAVKFTVTNKGGVASGAWGFVANLPIEGDPDYRFSSPVQASLLPGSSVEFTLGFDALLEETQGAIKIELVPGTKTDKTSNNIDAILVKIKQN